MRAPLALLAALHAAPPVPPTTSPAPTSPAPATADAPLPAPRPRIDLPEPAPVPRVILFERRGLRHYGAPRPFRSFAVRLGLGPGFRLAGPGTDRTHVAFDLLPTARLGLHRGHTQTALFPTLGYGLAAGETTRAHLFVAGLGLGLLSDDAAIAVVPALLVGAAERTHVLGLRTALLCDVLRHGVFGELAYQALALPTGLRHELRLTLGIDLVGLFVRTKKG